jgi:hypothetical protein
VSVVDAACSHMLIHTCRVPFFMASRRVRLVYRVPVIITGAMDAWPALGRHDPSRSWADMSYLKRLAGQRTVPVELGRSYMADDWRQEFLQLRRFIDDFVAASDGSRPNGLFLLAHLRRRRHRWCC